MTNCPFCGKLTDPKLENCPHCGGFLQRKSGSKGDAQRHTCPSCHALVQDGDIICVACGTNLLTGQKIAEERRLAVAEPSPAGKRIALAVVGLIVVIGAAVVLYMVTRDPLKQALQLKASGKLSEATKLLQDLAAKQPSDTRVFLELGKILYETNQAKLAFDPFEKAVKLDPENREAALLAVTCLADAADASNRPREIEILQDQVKRRPSDQECWYLLGLARGSNGDTAGQIDALQHAITLDPSRAEAHRYLGAALAIQGDFAGADKEFGAASQQQEENGDTAAAAGLAESINGRNEAAAKQLTDAVKRKTSVEAEALVQLGLLMIQQGQFPDAEDYLNRARKLGRNETADFFHAVAMQGQEMLDMAVSEFEAQSKGSGPYAGAALVNLAQIHLAQGNLDKARDTADKAAAQGNNTAPLLTVRGRILARTNNDTNAQDMFKKAIQADPNYAPAHLENGLLYVKRQVLTEGIRELERYIQLASVSIQEAGRITEIQALVDQLKQAAPPSEQGPPAPAPAAATTSGALS